MKPKDFYKLVSSTVAKMKSLRYGETYLDQWLRDFNQCLKDECADNIHLYPEEEDETD